MSHAGGKRKRNDPDGPGESNRAESERLLGMPRQEEADRLNDINRRVERLMKHHKETRNFQQAAKHVEDLKDDHEEVLEQKIIVHADATQKLREKRRKLGDEITTDVEQLEELQRQHYVFQKITLPRARQALKEEGEHIGALQNDIKKNKKEAKQLAEEQVAFHNKVAMEKAREKVNLAELKKEKARLKEAIKWGSEMTERADDASKQMDVYTDQSAHEINDLKENLSRYEASEEEMEASFREEFAAEVASEVSSKQATYSADINDGLQKLERNYSSQRVSNELKLRNLQDKNSDLQLTLDSKSSDLKSLNDEHNSLAARVRDAHTEVSRLNSRIHHENDNYSAKVRDSKKALAAKRVEKHTLDRAYDDLMDVRVALDQEINRYKSLLDNEESRLNYVSPHKQ